MLKKIFFILGKEIKSLPLVACLFILSSFIDIISLSLIAPFVLKIISTNSLENIHEYDFYLFTLESSFLTLKFLSISLIVIFLLKGVITAVIHYIITAYSFRQQKIIREKLFFQFLYHTRTSEIEEKKTSLMASIEFLSGQFATLVVQPILKITSDCLILLAILVFLVVSSGYIFIVSLLPFIITIYVYDLFFSPKLKKNGFIVNHAAKLVLKNVDEGLRGLKTIRIFGSEVFFYEKLKNATSRYARSQSIYALFLIIPKNLIEFLIILSGILFIYLSMSLEIEVSTILSSVAVIGVAALRVGPSVYSLSNSISQLRFGTDAVNKIYLDLTNFNFNTQDDKINHIKNDKKDSFKTLEMNNINFSYDEKTNSDINNINLKIKKNQFIGIIGPSGSGKSTLLNLMIGFLKAKSGQIILNSKSIQNARENLWPIIGYVPQEPFIFDDTIEKNIALKKELDSNDIKRVHESMIKVGLSDLLNDRDSGKSLMGESGSKLSGGQKQRIAIARALFFSKDVLILDEVTSSLDIVNEQKIIDLLNTIKNEITIIIVSHKYNSINKCDLVYYLEKGNLKYHGHPDDVWLKLDKNNINDNGKK